MNKKTLQDILLVLIEMDTFTQGDIQVALDMSQSSVSRLVISLEAGRYIERVRVGGVDLMTVTPRAVTVVSKMTPVDPMERVLLLRLLGRE